MSKVVVISIDALMSEDLKYCKTFPAFSSLFEKANIVSSLMGIYPTYTYPSHVSIMTGVYPNKHKIVHNESYPDKKWNYYAHDIKADTCLDIAKKNGLTTACITWPVMGGATCDYLIAETWAEKETDNPTPIFDSLNSPLAKEYFEKNKHLLNWMRTPGFDNFATACFCDIFKAHKPDLTFLHLSYLDHQRHQLGSASKKVLHALSFIDQKLQEIIDAVKSSGEYENTVFILLGDHGHRDYDTIFNINEVIRQMGYKDNIYAFSACFSAHVYLKKIEKARGYEVLKTIQKEYPTYLERILKTSDCDKKYNLNGDFDFVLEAKDNVIFDDKDDSVIIKHPNSEKKEAISGHGYSPEKGPFSPLIICGKDIIGGKVINQAKLVDIFPTILKLLSLPQPTGDGKIINIL